MPHSFGLHYKGDLIEPGWVCIDNTCTHSGIFEVLRNGASLMELKSSAGTVFVRTHEFTLSLVRSGYITFKKTDPRLSEADPNQVFLRRKECRT